MSANQTDTSAILNVLSAIAALSAVGLAVASELRAQKRFKQGNEIQERVAAAGIKPLLSINVTVGSNERSVTLSNEGLGTAIITEIVFTKDGRQSNRALPSVLNLNIRFEWDFLREFGERGCYLRAGQSVQLASLSIACLMEQGLPNATVGEILRTVDAQLRGLEISINFEDVLGNRQNPYETTLP